MEKRERRERPRKQRQAGGGRNDPPNNNSNRDTRDNRNKEKEKPSTAPKLEEKKVIDHTAIPDPHMFDNLKRETDEIAALTAKKHAKRQVFSNWSKYETLPDEDDNQRIGADYETLVRGAQLGSHFQLRIERIWDPKNLPTLSSAFTIDLGVLTASLASLPLHETLDLPVELIPTEDLESMERHARFRRESVPQQQKRRGKSVEKEGLAIYGSSLEKLMDRASLAEPQLSALPTQEARAETYPYVVDETDDLNFGTLPPPTKDITSVAQKKEKAPPIEKPQLRATPPRVEEVVRPSIPNQEESTPAKSETEGEPIVDSSSVPPGGSEKPRPTVEPEVYPEIEPSAEPQIHNESSDVLEKEVISEEISPIPEAVGKKKSRSGKNKTNKRRSLEHDLETSHQLLPTDQSVSSKNDSFLATEKLSEPSVIVQPSLKETNNPVPITEIKSEQPATNKQKLVSISKKAVESELVKKLVVEERSKTDLSTSHKESAEGGDKLKSSKTNVVASDAPMSSLPNSTLRSECKKAFENVQHISPKKDDELDELLSLRKPIPTQQVMNYAIPTSAVKASIDEDEVLPVSKPVITEKKEELEDWLDSMLDD